LPFGAAISGGQCDGHEGQLPKQYPPVDDVTAMGGYFLSSRRPVAAIRRRQTDPKPYFLVLRCLVSLQRILAVSDGVSPKA
jgi:hypothetical protein